MGVSEPALSPCSRGLANNVFFSLNQHQTPANQLTTFLSHRKSAPATSRVNMMKTLKKLCKE
jgi:hypothetical protein